MLHWDTSVALISLLVISLRGYGIPIIVLAASGVHSSDAFDTKGGCHCFYNIVG